MSKQKIKNHLTWASLKLVAAGFFLGLFLATDDNSLVYLVVAILQFASATIDLHYIDKNLEKLIES